MRCSNAEKLFRFQFSNGLAQPMPLVGAWGSVSACMVFAQMSSRDGLRDIVTCLSARTENLYHLGFTEPVAKSTLADANENRDGGWAGKPLQGGSSFDFMGFFGSLDFPGCPE